MLTKIDKSIAVRVTNTTDPSYLIRRHTQIAEFSVVTPEQSRHKKRVDMALFSMIPPDDPDLTAYLNKLLRMSKPEQWNNNFWLPTPENLGRPEDHTRIKTRILKQLIELEDKEEFNSEESTESQNNFQKWFGWTDRLLTEREKPAIDDILVDSYYIFDRHRIDFAMNTPFKVNLLPKDD